MVVQLPYIVGSLASYYCPCIILSDITLPIVMWFDGFMILIFGPMLLLLGAGATAIILMGSYAVLEWNKERADKWFGKAVVSNWSQAVLMMITEATVVSGILLLVPYYIGLAMPLPSDTFWPIWTLGFLVIGMFVCISLSFIALLGKIPDKYRPVEWIKRNWELAKKMTEDK